MGEWEMGRWVMDADANLVLALKGDVVMRGHGDDSGDVGGKRGGQVDWDHSRPRRCYLEGSMHEENPGRTVQTDYASVSFAGDRLKSGVAWK